MVPVTDDIGAFEKLEREKAAVAADKAKLAQEREEMEKRQVELEKKMERLLSGGFHPMGMSGMGMNDPMMMGGMMNPMMMGMMNPMMMGGMMNPMMMGGMGGFNPMMNAMGGMMHPMALGNMGQGGMNPMMMGGMSPMMGQGMTPMMGAQQGGMMGPGYPSMNGMNGNGMYGFAGNAVNGMGPATGMTGMPWNLGPSESKATAPKNSDTKAVPSVEASSASSSVTPSMKELIERKKAAEAETKAAASKTATQREKTDSVRQRFLDTDRGVDLLFLVDVTGSMAPWIDAVRTKIDLIIKEQEAMAPGRPLRVGFLGYRDLTDGTRFEMVHFVAPTDVQQFKSKVHAISASGGGDAPEDVAGALNRVHQFEWRSRTKLMIHIADAPCHGKKYHDLGDSYPTGDPEGLVPEELLVSLCSENKIDYYFVKINNTTDKMTGIFQEALSACDGVMFKCHELGGSPKELVKAVMESLSMSMGSAGGAAPGSSKASEVASLTRGLRSKGGDTVTEASWTKL